MQNAVVIWWLAGVVGGIAFSVGLSGLFWGWRKGYRARWIIFFLAIVIGFAGMSNSIFSILRLIHSCA